MMTDKTVLITGATDGIGKATALLFARQKYNIHLVARNRDKGNELLEKINSLYPEGEHRLFLTDLSDVKSTEEFLEGYSKTQQKLDKLILCAGVFVPGNSVNNKGLDLTFVVNYLSRYMFVAKLSHLLEKSGDAKVIYLGGSRFVNIRYDDISNPKYNKMFAIWQASTASAFMASFLDNPERNVRHIYWCPGIVNTALVKSQSYLMQKLSVLFGMIEPEEAADNLWNIIANENRNFFIKKNGKDFPKKIVNNKFQFERLMEFSAQITKVKMPGQASLVD